MKCPRIWLASSLRNSLTFICSKTPAAQIESPARTPICGTSSLSAARRVSTRWPRSAGGPYDGFLLSTANVFGDRLAQMMELLGNGQAAAAQRVIAPVEKVVPQVFQLVADLPWGNPFTNANKAMDHFMAYGSSATSSAAPYLHDGQSIPAEVIDATRKLLDQAGLLPDVGYLALA